MDLLIKSYKEQLHKSEERKFEDDFSRHKLHDTLVQACVSAFLTTDGIASRVAGYRFVTVEPLCELGVKNFDLLVMNEDQGLGIFVECKSSLSNPSTEVEEVIDKISVLEEHQSYLEVQIGARIDLKEYAICVPSDLQVEVATEIEKRKRSSDPQVDDPFVTWGFHMFDNTILKLFTKPSTTKEERPVYHRNADLTKAMSQGITVDTEVVTAVLPSSHPLEQAMSVVAWLLADNERLARDLRRFKKSKVLEFFGDSRNVPHYARETLSQELGQRFMREGVMRGLLREYADDPNVLEFAVEGKSVSTIVRNYKLGFKSSVVHESATRLAKRRAWEEYHSKQPSIFDFENSNQ